jgi:hypothetical protein
MSVSQLSLPVQHGATARRVLVVLTITAIAGLTGVVVRQAPPSLVLVASLAFVMSTVIVLHPPVAAYLVIGVTPLIAGIERGEVIPVLRPSEAVALLAGAGLVARGVIRSSRCGFTKPTLRRADVTILVLAVTSSVVPLLWMLLRGADVARDDILYALVIWKLYAIYLVIRCSIRTVEQTRIALYVSIIAAAIVAVVGILQVLHVASVTDALTRYYVPIGDSRAVLHDRGGSTLGLPIAAADLYVFNLAIAFGLLVRPVTRREQQVLIASSVLFVAGVVAAAEFSGVIALALAGAILAWLTGRGRAVLRMIPVLLAALWLLKPVLESRLSDIDPASGLPVSWLGRLDNLHTFFWPTLFRGANFVLGIRPSARVPTTKYAAGWVWIESGYTWLLWAGGIPLLLAFLYFLRENIRGNLGPARTRQDAVGVAALAVVVTLSVVAVAMLLDPHLTYRGSGDLLFALLALAGVRASFIPHVVRHDEAVLSRAAPSNRESRSETGD